MCISQMVHIVVDLMEGFFAYHRDSDKLIFERLQKEFEAARAAQTEGTPYMGFFPLNGPCLLGFFFFLFELFLFLLFIFCWFAL